MANVFGGRLSLLDLVLEPALLTGRGAMRSNPGATSTSDLSGADAMRETYACFVLLDRSLRVD